MGVSGVTLHAQVAPDQTPELEMKIPALRLLHRVAAILDEYDLESTGAAGPSLPPPRARTPPPPGVSTGGENTADGRPRPPLTLAE